jgi:gamma-glutamyltranspeptidase
MKLKTKYGMVVSGHKKATKAGMKILKSGGNAMDAAIAAAATLSVAIPNMNGLGGDSIALWYSSKSKKILTINGSGKSPKKASISYFKSLGLREIPQRSPLSITVPGVVDAWDTSLKKFGKKKLKNVLNDAIKLAENGIKIDKYLNDFFKGDVYKRLIKNNKNLSNIYGLPKDIKLGKIIKQKKLAETLKILAKFGSKSFYQGNLSKLMLKDLRQQGSILSKNDFCNHSTLIQKPINTEYFGKSVFSAPPNSQGLALIGLCNLFNNIDKKIEINDYLKIKKEIFFLRDMYCLDPSISKLSKNKNKNKIQIIKNNSKKVSGDTSTLVVVDKYGNAVSWVQSLFEEFGSGIVSPNTGVVFHNRMYLEKIFKKGHNKLKSQKRPFHTLCPAIVLNNKDLDLTICTPGDHGQPQTIFQILNYVYNYKYSIEKAILAPRIRHNLGNEILVEKGFNKNFKTLKNKKIKFKVYNKPHRIFGGVTAIKVNSNKTISKGADKRRNCF